jgi:hypothetical protein
MAIPGGTRIYTESKMPVAPIEMGTLGCWVRFNGSPVMLSNRHVFAKWGGGVWLEDPRKARHLKSSSIVATVSTRRTELDAALATPTTTTRLLHPTHEIIQLGAYRGFRQPTIGLDVVTYGATTMQVLSGPLMEGRIFKSSTVKKLGTEEYMTTETLMIGGILSKSGDSGSAVLDRETRALVGLVCGVAGNRTYMVPIDKIVSALRIQPL